APPAAEYATNAAACFAGLRAAARLAAARSSEAARCRAGAERIRAGVRRFLWSERDRRFLRGTRPESRGLDLLMVWLSEPFGLLASDDPQMRATVAALRHGLRLDDGLYRGLVRSVGDEPWLHQNALLADYLYAAGDGRG